jgi:hypothetical protein
MFLKPSTFMEHELCDMDVTLKNIYLKYESQRNEFVYH